MARAGFRPVASAELILQLDKDVKIVHFAASAVSPFPDSARKCFRATGHEDVSDDEHLYAAARARSTFVVTQDQYLLKRAAEIERHTQVKTFQPGDVLAAWGIEA